MKNKKIKIDIIVLFVLLAFFMVLKNKETLSIMYLASDTSTVVVKDGNNNDYSFIRGQEVKKSNKSKKIDNINLNKIYIDGKPYYVEDTKLVENKEDAVLEKELWVYRTCSVYKDEDSSLLNGLINKGEKIEVIGHSELKEDGSVERYKYEGGYIYSKYLTSDEEYAKKDNDSIYGLEMLKHTEDTYGAGSASELDYYENEKPIFENNVMPEICRSLYINAEAIKNIDDYINLSKETNVNTFVIDIRDSDVVTYKSDVIKTYSPTSYDVACYTKEELKEQLDKVKEAGIYMVARITVFKDKNFMIDHPEYAILDINDDNKPFEYGSSYWPSPYSREVWQYNVELAKEVVNEFGFNEIEFDYVRFPERIDYYADVLNALELQNTYNETRSEAIQRFLMYACDEIHKVNAYVSVDVFGETSNDYVCAYGQYLPAISNVVDVVSPMPYPDHFNKHDYGIEEVVWTVPYKLLSVWAKQVKERQSEIPSPALIRTYIQGYDSIKRPYIEYDNDKLAEQIEALIDSEIYSNGYIIWNGASNIDKYYSFKEALSKY